MMKCRHSAMIDHPVAYKKYACDENQMDIPDLVSPSPKCHPNTDIEISNKEQRLSKRQLATEHRAPLHDIRPFKSSIRYEKTLQDGYFMPIPNDVCTEMNIDHIVPPDITMSRKRCVSPTLPSDEYTVESNSLSNTSSSPLCGNHASHSRRRKPSRHTRNKFVISSTEDYKSMTSVYSRRRRRRNHAVSSMDFETLLPYVLPPPSPPPPDTQQWSDSNATTMSWIPCTQSTEPFQPHYIQ